MALGKLAPLLTAALLSAGCTAANDDETKHEVHQTASCIIPPLTYDVPDNPYGSRLVMTKKAFDDARNKSADGDGSASFAIAQHILGQLKADTDAAECWFKISSQQGYEPARLQLAILSLLEAKRYCSRAKKYSEQYALGPATLGEGWSSVLNSCRALLGERL